jgi:hypothetical protein
MMHYAEKNPKEYEVRTIPAFLRLFVSGIFSGESENPEKREKEGPGCA